MDVGCPAQRSKAELETRGQIGRGSSHLTKHQLMQRMRGMKVLLNVGFSTHHSPYPLTPESSPTFKALGSPTSESEARAFRFGSGPSTLKVGVGFQRHADQLVETQRSACLPLYIPRV